MEVIKKMVEEIKKMPNEIIFRNNGNTGKLVKVTCPKCLREFKLSRRKKPGKLGKYNYEVPLHFRDGHKCRGSARIVTF